MILADRTKIINGLGPVCAAKAGGGLDLLDFLARL